jgi:hypothetical protein
MATITPDEGLEWLVEKSINDSNVTDERIYSVAVGTGNAALSPSDTQLDQEEHRSTVDDSIVSIEDTSPAVGELTFKITVSGGTEVPAGTSVTEFAVFARDPSINSGNVTDSDDTMLYRELRTGVSIESGDRKTFEFDINIVN